jgi:hypothetical protein
MKKEANRFRKPITNVIRLVNRRKGTSAVHFDEVLNFDIGCGPGQVYTSQPNKLSILSIGKDPGVGFVVSGLGFSERINDASSWGYIGGMCSHESRWGVCLSGTINRSSVIHVGNIAPGGDHGIDLDAKELPESFVANLLEVCRVRGLGAIIQREDYDNGNRRTLTDELQKRLGPIRLLTEWTMGSVWKGINRLITSDRSTDDANRMFGGIRLIEVNSQMNATGSRREVDVVRISMNDGEIQKSSFELRNPAASRPQQPSYDDSPNERNREAAHERFEFEQSMRGENY